MTRRHSIGYILEIDSKDESADIDDDALTLICTQVESSFIRGTDKPSPIDEGKLLSLLMRSPSPV